MWRKMYCIVTENIHWIDVLFGGMWLYGWFHNAEQAIKYDLDKLKDFYIWIRGYITATHGINSGLNTPIPGMQKGGVREEPPASGS